ncbi:MAG TPA: FAD-binding oxidoreductase [Gemmatimonadaceae bacterium]
MPHRRSRAVRARQATIAQLGALPATGSGKTPFTPADAAALQAQVVGSVILPSSAAYNDDRQLSDPVWQSFPNIIVYCKVFEDVWHSLAFAHRFGLHVLCRSGGHSTAGFSVDDDAMIVDTSGICYVTVDWAGRVATVGAGTNLGTLNAVLDGYQLHTPGGACPDVCVAGHMMGGGYGWTSREFGMNCDSVSEVLVMLSDGRTVRANESLNPDLYWAARGGTGNNFGVLLEVKYRLYDLWKVWGFGFSYPMTQAAEALYRLQRDYMLDAAPREMGYQVAWITQDGAKRLVVRGVYHGEPEAGRKLIAPLLALPGAVNEVDTVDTYNALNEGLIEKPYAYPDIPDNALEDKISGYLARQLDVAEWKGLTDAARRDASGWAFANLEVYGGAVNARPVDSNAFIHRRVYFDWVQDVFWTNSTQRDVARKFLAEMISAWSPYLNGHANQDYPRRSQSNYRWLFFGEAYNSLLWVKNKYDPSNFFRFPQSISPYPPGEEPRATAPSLFSDPGIVEEPYSRRITG